MEAAEVSGPPVGNVSRALNQSWSRGLFIISVSETTPLACFLAFALAVPAARKAHLSTFFFFFLSFFHLLLTNSSFNKA